jgi:acyl-coenzyme A synthetase/AMP-(fatty) acid ligase
VATDRPQLHVGDDGAAKGRGLPHFATPRTVIFGPLPTTATGKIQKYELRARAQTL